MANINDILKEIDASSYKSTSFICLPEDCRQHLISSTPRNFNLLHLNIRSVSKNFDHLQVLINQTKISFDVVILTECWLSKVACIPVLDGFLSHSSITNYNQNDGIIIYTRLGLQATVREPKFEGGNCLVCELGGSELAVVAVYRSPSLNSNSNFNSFLSHLDGVYSSISRYSNIVLMGDMNLDLCPTNRSDRTVDYLMLNASHGLLPTHLTPTRLERCLDHIFLKSNLSSTSLILESHITDHKPIFLNISNFDSPRKSLHKVTRLDYPAIIADLENLDFSPMYNTDDVNTSTNIFIDTVTSIVSKHSFQVNVPRKKHVIKPWITPGLLRCIQNRDRMHINANKSPDNIILKNTYTRYRNFCNDLLRKLRTAYDANELKKANNCPRKLWQTINSITNRHKPHSGPSELLDLKDNHRSSINEVCHFFSSIGSVLANNITSQRHASNMPATHLSTPYHSPQFVQANSLALIEVSESEVEALILQLRDRSAVGWDGLSPLLLKCTRHVLVPHITFLCNLSLRTGVFPDAFKKAIIHPIYKGGDRNCVTNYRPISVLPALSKVLERILNNQLRRFLDKFQIISSNQYGFRSNLSTEDAVLELTQSVARKLDNNIKCLGIFLDLSKAFDTVSIPNLLSKLEVVGVRGITLDLFRSYLTNRKQCVKIDADLSDEDTISYGVPQGSVLGPTLFLVYVNDLCKMNLPNCNIYAYADDTAIVVHGPTWGMVKESAEAAMSSIMIWLNSNLLTLNINKTTFIPFGLRRGSSPGSDFTLGAHSCHDPSLLCSCPTISRSSSVKYLGVHIDCGLRWDKQIEVLTSRTMRLIHIIKSLRDAADLATLKMIYFSLCQAILGYCITVWGGAAKTLLLRVERAQRAILKVMTKKPFRYPTTELYSNCKVLTVRQLFVLKSILRTHKSLPPPDRNKRTLALPSAQHRTSFARHQYYILSLHLYKTVNRNIKIMDLNSHNLKNKLTEWLLQRDYSFTESLLTFIR